MCVCPFKNWKYSWNKEYKAVSLPLAVLQGLFEAMWVLPAGQWKNEAPKTQLAVMMWWWWWWWWAPLLLCGTAGLHTRWQHVCVCACGHAHLGLNCLLFQTPAAGFASVTGDNSVRPHCEIHWNLLFNPTFTSLMVQTRLELLSLSLFLCDPKISVLTNASLLFCPYRKARVGIM